MSNHNKPRSFFGALCAISLAFGAAASCGSGANSVDRPNVLFVVFDTTRADHLSSYGYQKLTSPRVDGLARSGARFDAARSASTLTPVSASTFLTGLQPPRTGVRSLFLFSQQSLNQGVVTLAERLRGSGYETAAFVSAAPMGARYGLDRGFDVYNDDVNQEARRLQKLKVGNAFQRRADTTTDLALGWLEAHFEEELGPFGLMVHFFDAHDAAMIPPRKFLASRVSFPLPANLDQIGHLHNLFAGADHGQGGERQDDLIELYDAEIEFMDKQLGRILDDLAARNELENTLVVFLADHGESLGQHDFWTHGFMWDEQLRVPLILSGPGVESGTVVPEPVSLVDLVPSLVSQGGLLGMSLEPGEQLDGQSFAGLVTPGFTGDAFLQRPVVSEVHNSKEDRTGRPEALFAVTAMPWKLIVEPGQTPKLFHLGDDPGELADLYSKEHPMVRALSAVLAASGSLESADLPNLEDLTEEERSMLQGLGYF